MKCANCGQWNKAHFTKCFKCGAPLGTHNEPSPERIRETPSEPVTEAVAQETARLSISVPPVAAGLVSQPDREDTQTHDTSAIEAAAEEHVVTETHKPRSPSFFTRIKGLLRRDTNDRGTIDDLPVNEPPAAEPQMTAAEEPSVTENRVSSSTPAQNALKAEESAELDEEPERVRLAPVKNFNPEATLARMMQSRQPKPQVKQPPPEPKPVFQRRDATRPWSTRSPRPSAPPLHQVQPEIDPESVTVALPEPPPISEPPQTPRATTPFQERDAMRPWSTRAPLAPIPPSPQDESKIVPESATEELPGPSPHSVPLQASRISLSIEKPAAQSTASPPTELVTAEVETEYRPTEPPPLSEPFQPRMSADESAPAETPEVPRTTARLLANRRFALPVEHPTDENHPAQSEPTLSIPQFTDAGTHRQAMRPTVTSGGAGSDDRRTFAYSRDRSALPSAVPHDPQPQTQNRQPQPAVKRVPTSPRAQRAPSTVVRPPLAPRKRQNLGMVGKRSNPLVRTLIVAAIGVGMIALLAWGASKGYQAIVSLISDQRIATLPTPALDPSLPTPSISTDTVNGNVIHTITFTGKDDDFIYIPEIPSGKNTRIIGQIAKFEIPDSIWIEAQTSELNEFIDVTLNPKLIKADGTEKQLPPVQYVVEVPLSKLDMINPTEERVETYTSNYQVQFKVDVGSSVTIGGDDFNDLVNADGVVTRVLHVDPVGDNFIEITAQARGHRKKTIVLNIYRPHMDIELELDPSTPETSNSQTMRITGHTEIGAAVKVESDISGSLELEKATGSFLFNAKLTRYGINTIIIRASMSGKEDSVIKHNVYYKPNLDEYSRKAQSLVQNIKELRANPSRRIGIIYVFDGQVEEIANAEKPMSILFDASTKSQEIKVWLEYEGDKKWELGRKMRVYADCIGEKDGLPLLAARFIYYD